MVQRVYDSRGQEIVLGTELGRGGEGSVFDIRGDSRSVAKVYHKTVPPEKAAKLLAMVSLRTDRLLSLTAWPVDLLRVSPGGLVTGLLMPRVAGLKEIHLLYSPKSRLIAFADADWKFLVRAASNVARAFAVIHEHGHVIGDVNHGNIVVASDATVKLIDCDSFQITPPGQRYLCEVGISTHTPPELQGGSFKGTVRTVNHDAFGLAVLIFQLLFLGRHPFSGRYVGSGDMSLEKAITEFRFAYGNGAVSRQMQPPPRTLALEAVSLPVAQLFEKAFSHASVQHSMRPTSRDWIAALDTLYKQIQTCTLHPGHSYYNGLSTCPWCSLDAGAHHPIFNVAFRNVIRSQHNFNLAGVWTQIQGVPSPGSMPLPTPANITQLRPSQAAIELRAIRIRSLLIVVLTSLCVGLLLGIVIPASGLAGIAFVVGIFSAFPIAETSTKPKRAQMKAALNTAQTAVRTLETRWHQEAQGERFFQKHRELCTLKAEYEVLPSVHQQRLRELASQSRERQRRRFLDQNKIRHANISGLGPSRIATLQSYGIETAADIEANTILGVPGFGPVYTNNLLAWRAIVEQRFVFDASRGIDPADNAALDKEMEAKRNTLEQQLQNGATQLRYVAQQINAQRQNLAPALQQAYNVASQIALDCKRVENLMLRL